EELSQPHRPIYSRLDQVPDSSTRPVVVSDQIDLRAATLRALDILQQAPIGYVLVVEWDVHTNDPRKGLQNIVEFDRLIAEVESRVDLDHTRLLFTADHSFGIQVGGGSPGDDLLEGYDAWMASGSDEDVVRLEHVLVNDS